MSGHHDVGGQPGAAVEREERPLAFWEHRLEAIRDCLARRPQPLVRTDEMRQAMETMDPALYASLGFYERKAWALREVLTHRGVLPVQELEQRETHIRAARAGAIGMLPARFDHRHDHDDVKDDESRPSDHDVRLEAVYLALVERGLLSASEVHTMVERLEGASPAQGARAVARAWCDREYRQRLLADGKTALAELGIEAMEAALVVVENTPALHNVLVCTLCSCYPRTVLGPPPAWYVSKAYRSRVVREPRAVLAEFGTELPPGTEVRVHDSNADMRYLVLPLRPEGTDGWDEQRLAGLVTRDALIGVATAGRA